jgi:ABC-type Na+ efflux pump permease subunit
MFRLPRLVGPVAGFELARMARRGRFHLLRGLYPLVPAIALAVLVAQWRFADVRAPGALRVQLAALAEWYFVVFLVVQLAAVYLLTPVVLAGSVAREKERRTLEFVLTTDLSGAEVLFGKLSAGLATLAVLLLAGLPVLSAVQMLGGVEPTLVWAGFAATGVTLLSQAALDTFERVANRRPRPGPRPPAGA